MLLRCFGDSGIDSLAKDLRCLRLASYAVALLARDGGLLGAEDETSASDSSEHEVNADEALISSFTVGVLCRIELDERGVVWWKGAETVRLPVDMNCVLTGLVGTEVMGSGDCIVG